MLFLSVLDGFRFFCDDLHRPAAYRFVITVQLRCKVNAEWQARLAFAEPQPAIAVASSLQRQRYNISKSDFPIREDTA
jgi:hypothetical protein